MDITYFNKDFFEENENIRAFFCRTHSEETMHSHEFWELGYVYEGIATHHTDKKDKLVKAGDFILIKPGTRHSVTAPQNGAPTWMCNCLFTQNYFELLMQEYWNISELADYALHDMLLGSDPFYLHLSDDNAKNVKHLMWLTAHEYNHFTAGSELIMKNATLDLLVIITRLYEYSVKKAVPTVSRNDEIDRLMKYMRSNFGYKLTLDFLAEQVHLSKEYLSRYFKQYTGNTILEFLTEIRISKAKEMLRTSSHSIEDIGAYCGYPSVSNFQKTFKKATNLSPSEYRKIAKKEK